MFDNCNNNMNFHFPPLNARNGSKLIIQNYNNFIELAFITAILIINSNRLLRSKGTKLYRVNVANSMSNAVCKLLCHFSYQHSKGIQLHDERAVEFYLSPFRATFYLATRKQLSNSTRVQLVIRIKC